MATQDPRKLIVLGFDSRLKAEEALLAATRLQNEGQILLHDAVFVSKDEAGATSVTETVDQAPGDAALNGSIWGMLFGTLLAGPVGTVLGGALSAGAGALAIWLHNLRDIEFLPRYREPGRGGYAGKAIKVGPAVTVLQAYEFAHEHGVSVLGGIAEVSATRQEWGSKSGQT